MTQESIWDLIGLADQAYERGSYQQAIGLYESAVAQSSRGGQERAGLVALDSICFCYTAIPDWENCLKAATRLLTRARALQSPEYEMRAVFHLARAMAAIDLGGRWSELKPLLLQGIERARQFRNIFWQVKHLILLAMCELQLDDAESAFSRLQEALNLISSDDSETGQGLRASIYATLTLVHANRGKFRDARFYMEMAGGLVQALKDVHGMTELSLLETYINVMADEDFQVPEFVAMALSTAGGSGWKGTEFLACWLEAFRLAESGHIEEALNLLSRASELARAMKSKLAEAACLIWLAYEFVNQDNVIQTSQYLDVGLSLESIERAGYLQFRAY